MTDYSYALAAPLNSIAEAIRLVGKSLDRIATVMEKKESLTNARPYISADSLKLRELDAADRGTGSYREGTRNTASPPTSLGSGQRGHRKAPPFRGVGGTLLTPPPRKPK